MPSAIPRSVALLLALALPSGILAGPAPPSGDPCAAIAGKPFVPPRDALACLKSFPFNETLRQNVLTVASRVLDFYTFEPYYLRSPPPFQGSTKNIRAELGRIGRTAYKTDYDFNRDLFDFTVQLNDGHTRWIPDCYVNVFQNFLPTPLVTLEKDGAQGVFIAPDAVEFTTLLGEGFTSYYDGISFDWKRLAGARVLAIEGRAPYAYVDGVADARSGNYLDHGVRVNSVFSSYRIANGGYSQKSGDVAGWVIPDQETLTLTLVPAGSTRAETVKVPFLAAYADRAPFTDKQSFWDANCAATAATNGRDNKGLSSAARRARRHPIASVEIEGAQPRVVLELPSQFLPTLPTVGRNGEVVKSYILPDSQTGVMFVGSFGPLDFDGFQKDVESAVKAFKAAGVSKLLIDVTNNGGGYVCLGHFLHQYLAGSKNLGNPGFQSTLRANALAKKIIQSDIAQGLDQTLTFYTPDNYAYISNNTQLPPNVDYTAPSNTVVINGQRYEESQRFFDTCAVTFSVDMPVDPPFDPKKIAIVGNGNCASTCAMFTTLMFERHHSKLAVFGGKPFAPVEFKGMAGNQVLDWTALDSEVKTANLKNDPLAPPDLLVSANMRVNWRTAYSWIDEKVPIEYRSEPAPFRFPYTADTYNNPQNLWIYAAKKLF